MLAICWKPYLSSAIAVMTVTALSPAATGAGPHDSQTLAAAQAVAAIMEDTIATAVFQRRVANYVTLHRLLEGPLPMPQRATDMRTVRGAAQALAARLQAARKDARQGEIFTDDVTRMFHRRLATCLAQEEIATMLAQQEYGEDVQATLRVNAVWPVTVPFDFVPPQVLATLPHLAPELQYRIIGRSLVLWDHHANLIVDILPGALITGGPDDQ
jgi:hypothetical protein